MTWFDTTLNWLGKHIPWQITFGLFVATGVLLFFSAHLAIYEWAHPYRGLEVTVFAFSGAVLLANTGLSFVGWVGRHVHSFGVRRRVRKYLYGLTLKEKYILQRYMEEQTRTEYLKMNDGVVAGLIEHGVIYPAPVHYARGSTLAHNITDFAWVYRAHPELFETSDKPRPKPTGSEWTAD
jgi:hypothetical protein